MKDIHRTFTGQKKTFAIDPLLSTFFASENISLTIVVFCPIQVRHRSFICPALLTQSSNCNSD
jgi:hypothetical protein